MKKSLLVLFAFIALSCSKDDDEVVNVVPPATFQIINDMTPQTTEIEELNGTLYEVVIFLFSEGDLVGDYSLSYPIKPGQQTDELTPEDYVGKIKVSFKLLPEESPYYKNADRKYTASYTVLSPGNNTIISIGDDTMVTGSLSGVNARANESNDVISSFSSLSSQ